MIAHEKLTPAQCHDVWQELAPDERRAVAALGPRSVPRGLMRSLRAAAFGVLLPTESVLQVTSNGGPTFDALVPEFLDWIQEFGHVDH